MAAVTDTFIKSTDTLLIRLNLQDLPFSTQNSNSETSDHGHHSEPQDLPIIHHASEKAASTLNDYPRKKITVVTYASRRREGRHIQK